MTKRGAPKKHIRAYRRENNKTMEQVKEMTEDAEAWKLEANHYKEAWQAEKICSNAYLRQAEGMRESKKHGLRIAFLLGILTGIAIAKILLMTMGR